jgi:hypothetical protein
MIRRTRRPALLVCAAFGVLLFGAGSAVATLPPQEDALFTAQADLSLTQTFVNAKAGLPVTTGTPIVFHTNGSQAAHFPAGFKTVAGPFSSGPFDAIVISGVADSSTPADATFSAVIKNGTTNQVITSVSTISLSSLPLDFVSPPAEHCQASFGDPAFPATVTFEITLAPPVNVVHVAPTDDLQLILTPTGVFGSTMHLCVGDVTFGTGMGLVVQPLPVPITLAPPSATQTIGANQTLTATVVDDNGDPVNGATVHFNVSSGPNSGSTGTGTTNSAGQATFTYTSAAPGTDVVQASFSDANGTHTSNTSSVTWLPLATVLTYTGATSADYHDSAGLSAVLTDVNNNPLSGQPVSFSMGLESCSGTTNGSGTASCSIDVADVPGAQTVSASFAGTTALQPSSASSPFTVTPEEATLTYTGGTTADYHDPATLSAVLLEDGTTPIAGRSVTLSLGSQSCAPVLTDATGTATCTIASIEQPAGTVGATATFAGDAFYVPANASATFAITKEETTLTYTGPTVIANGQAATLSALLREDGTVPIAGRAVLMTLGSGAGAQSCTGTTQANGTASCTIGSVNQPLGFGGAVSATFAGDAFYKPSNASASTLLFAFPAHGAFVIGDQSDASKPVTFWGAQWSKLNTLSGGGAPSSFKGFAEATGAPGCGQAWTSGPGNSSGPPGTVPAFMGVLVAGSVTQNGSVLSGSTTRIVVVRTGAGYGPTPGTAGIGTVVGVAC